MTKSDYGSTVDFPVQTEPSSWSMNLTGHMDRLADAFSRNFTTFAISLIINCVNGTFVYIYFKSEVFHRDPRYVLYIHLVINDMIILTMSVLLQILTYTVSIPFFPCSFILLILMTTNKNSSLNLASMAVERYIAVCRPLHHVHICTVQRVYTVIALIWGISFIPALIDVIIFLATTQSLSSLFSRRFMCIRANLYATPYHNALSLVVQVLLFSFVFLTLIITYLKVLLAAQAASGSSRTSARNAHNTILLHGLQLFISMSSYLTPSLNVTLTTMWPHDRTNILFITFLLTIMLPRLLSPFIYGVRDKTFSSHIRLHFCCKCCDSLEKKGNQAGYQRRSKKERI